ncbi:hypothetical protein PVIIG_04611 [Plasmodium vivax India VII]|uniref:Uncharacterized protein n=1 Tax=Plasmodium vivax India VII TaxID=1077284 RepID=A0A0J9SIM2_PLAVI|nr:hypothetical protein PVIIG_04611 [Plasmodium vivax India VII]
MVELECEIYYRTKQKNHEYFYYEFSDVKSVFSNVTEPYLEKVKNIEDPILQHISLYLVHNYNNYKPDFSDTGDYSKNEACKNLNRWIDKEKSIYTRATKCSKNKDAWNKHIESLWEKLQINNNNGKKCNRYEHFSNTTTFPDELKEYTCYQHVPENYTCTAPQVNSSTTENPCSNCITTCPPCKNNCTNSESTIQSSYLTSTPDNCATICTQMCPDGFPSLIPTVSISVCFTLLGVFILQFFLYKVIKNVLL